MSATIPNGMLLSDLLKATGYNCPDDLQGKTFSQATSGGEADLEANHASTVDVGEYTQPIEITPAEGKEGMEKVTLTLTNIPSEADIEANKEATIDVSAYTEPVEITPTAGKDGMAKATVTLTNIPSGGGNQGYSVLLENGDSDGTIFSKIVCFGGATPTVNSIPAGTYNAFFVTDDVYTGEGHDFTDIPSLFTNPSNVSVTQVGNMPNYYRVVISAGALINSSGEYGTQGRRALLTLFPVGA